MTRESQAAGATGRLQLLYGAAAGLVCAALLALLQVAGLLEPLELSLYDLHCRLSPVYAEPEPPGHIVILTLDQGSIEHVYTHQGARPPWPRLYYGLMIEFLQAAGARAIIFDMFFTEPDIDRLDVTAAESDGALLAATAAAGNVVHAAVLQQDGLPPEAGKRAALQRALARLPVAAGRALPQYPAALLPDAGLIDAAWAIGSVAVHTDHDNVLRRVHPVQALDGTAVPALAVAAYAALSGADALSVEPARLRVGGRSAPLTRDGALYLRWYRAPAGEPGPFPYLSAANVLTSRIQQLRGQPTLVDPELVRDRIVLIGSTAPGLMDIKATPLSNAVPGVQFQATLLANLLRGDSVRRWPARDVLLLLLAGSLLTGIAARGWRRHCGGLLVFAGAAVALLLSGYTALVQWQIFVPVVTPLLGMAGSFFAVTVINHITERRQTRLVRGIFEHYLDSAVVRTLIRNPERVRLGGEERDCTVLFSDVADFTALSERLAPEALVRLMNLYLDAMTAIIIEEGGFVDKFIGDEIVAIFGAPAPLPDHAARACRAALRMAARVVELQPQFRALGCTADLFARTGISTGTVIVGNMGSENRMNYTAMGDAVNLGARIEGVNKVYGTRLLISEGTAAAAGAAVVLREVDAVRVKGRQAGLRLFELLALRRAAAGADERPEGVQRFERALADYRAGRWREAQAEFAALAAAGDAVAGVFDARCAALERDPPEHWDGITTMLTK